MMVLLENECSLSGQDNHRWWGHLNPNSCQKTFFIQSVAVGM